MKGCEHDSRYLPRIQKYLSLTNTLAYYEKTQIKVKNAFYLHWFGVTCTTVNEPNKLEYYITLVFKGLTGSNTTF